MSDRSELLRTALHDKHIAMDASMGDVAGWEMPLSYGGAIDEAGLVRQRAGVFDAGHLGRIRIRGDGALGLLERVCTHDVAHQEDDTVAPTLLLGERGGILDVGKLARLEDSWLLITSAVNRVKILEHLAGLAGDMDAKVDDRTSKECSLLVAGPDAPRLLDSALESVLSEKASALGQGRVRSGSHLLAKYVVARTDELGMWSAQVILPGMFAGKAWRYITEKAGENCIAPAGLAAWDVLRIEAGERLYGHEVNESFDPYMAGLGGLVSDRPDFIGALHRRQLAARPPARKLVGVVLTEELGGAWPSTHPQGEQRLEGGTNPSPELGQSSGRFIPRQGMTVLDGHGDEIGTVTSGTFSPRLEHAIGLAYVTTSAAIAGLQVSIEQEGVKYAARIAELPF